jgi:hypothetical protein
MTKPALPNHRPHLPSKLGQSERNSWQVLGTYEPTAQSVNDHSGRYVTNEYPHLQHEEATEAFTSHFYLGKQRLVVLTCTTISMPTSSHFEVERTIYTVEQISFCQMPSHSSSACLPILLSSMDARQTVCHPSNLKKLIPESQ